MRNPDFMVSHRTTDNRPETRIRFSFMPPRDVMERLRQSGFRYFPQRRTWSKQEMVEEFKIRAIVENWPDN